MWKADKTGKTHTDRLALVLLIRVGGVPVFEQQRLPPYMRAFVVTFFQKA